MFGSDMFGKLQEMQKAAEESKKKLDEMIVSGSTPGKEVTIELTASRNFKSIKINTDIRDLEKEDLEDLVSVAFTRALDEANKINEQEVMLSAKSFLPGM